MANYSNEAKNVKPLTPTVAIWVLGTAIEHPVPDRVKPSFVIFWHPGTLALSPERQSQTVKRQRAPKGLAGTLIAEQEALQWTPQGHRSRGRPWFAKNTWKKRSR